MGLKGREGERKRRGLGLKGRMGEGERGREEGWVSKGEREKRTRTQRKEGRKGEKERKYGGVKH